MTSERPAPRRLLADGVASLAGCLQPDGTLHDPVFDTPTQYGSAYYAWCCAVLATNPGTGAAGGDEGYRDRAVRLLGAAAEHTADPEREPYASGFDRRTLSVTGRLNHRDFTWPPILKTYLALQGAADAPEASGNGELARLLARVRVDSSFRSRPPSNWAAVWMSGEWLRMQAGLSPTTAEEFDGWLDAFFAGGEVGFDLELGMYLERGLPNAYDLFTRAHFTDLLLSGYAGRHRPGLESFLTTGLRRSLGMQLSDGSMASGFRSAGQTWVLGAQVALFTGSRVLGLGTPDQQQAARLAAWRAYRSLAGWQREDGVFSPVQNLLPPQLRVGYETYTSDGHYSPLALGFLATALRAGFGDEEPPSDAELDAAPAAVLAEGPPTHRAVARRGRIAMAVQAVADDSYDATGLVDLTFGVGRRLQLVSAARHLSGGPWLVPGLAVRSEPGAAPATALGGLYHRVLTGPNAEQEAGLGFETSLETGELAGSRYRWQGTTTTDGVTVTESLVGWPGHRTLLVPYLRDLGSGDTTVTSYTDTGVRFTLGQEWVEFAVDGRIERRSDLPYGYENRRGLCGLVRLDLAEPGASIRWSVVSSS